jgi:hypothetical protein
MLKDLERARQALERKAAVLDAASEVDEKSLSSNVVFLGWNKKQLSRKVMVFQL